MLTHMLDSLDTERQISRQKNLLYIVKNSITLLITLMLFWFVCVTTVSDTEMIFCTELCLSEEVLFMCLNGLRCSQNAGKLHSESTKFQIFLGEHAPKPP